MQTHSGYATCRKCLSDGTQLHTHTHTRRHTHAHTRAFTQEHGPIQIPPSFSPPPPPSLNLRSSSSSSWRRNLNACTLTAAQHPQQTLHGHPQFHPHPRPRSLPPRSNIRWPKCHPLFTTSQASSIGSLGTLGQPLLPPLSLHPARTLPQTRVPPQPPRAAAQHACRSCSRH